MHKAQKEIERGRTENHLLLRQVKGRGNWGCWWWFTGEGMVVEQLSIGKPIMNKFVMEYLMVIQ